MNVTTHQIAASLIPGIGHISAKKLIAYCGGADAIFSEKPSTLYKIPGIGKLIADKIISHRNEAIKMAEKEIEFCIKHHIKAHYFLNEDYPNRLFHCEDGPVILYTKGQVNLNPKKVISIVGSRKSTVKGRDFCEKLVADLRKHEITIVSGLAYGIDICAHKACMANEIPTQAVLASSLNQVYPKLHQKYVEAMLDKGGIISDYSSHSTLIPSNFAERNRIVAGMCDAVVVIESSEKGGSLITADLANGYNRDVFAVPGRPDDDQSKGCNQLIKSNKAHLIESAEDIALILGWQNEPIPSPKQKALFVELTADEQQLMRTFEGKDILAVDEISLMSHFSMSKTASLLLSIEFKGKLRSLPGKRYEVMA